MTTRRRTFIGSVLGELAGDGRAYRAWITVLMTGIVLGAFGYGRQLRDGLFATHMTDQISWGAYIANFTFVVGVGASAVTVLVPAYVFRLRSFRRIVFVGEMLALSAVSMAMLFVTVDLGRPDRSWHLIPWIGSLNWPASLLSWDVVVLGGYLTINFFIVVLSLYAQFHGRKKPAIYVPLIFVSMAWAISLLLDEAFLYTWLGARPFWNSAIVAPRFLVSAFVSGPAFLMLALRVMRRGLGFAVDDEVFTIFRRILTVTLLTNLFLFAAEVFTELFSGSLHGASMRYLLFGRDGHHDLTGFVWLAIGMNVVCALILVTPLHKRARLVDLACAMAFVGVWIEKGMGLIIPGFLPTPLGEMTEYFPSIVELAVIVGVWSLGMMMFTVLVRVAMRVEEGTMRASGATRERMESLPPP
jgi:Ni/Fe-hydrogenase subunit HybB-like protein